MPFVCTVFVSLVVQPDRTCEVSVGTERMFISSSIQPSSDDVICGSRDRTWLLEAPSGQRINVSLLDLSGSSSSPTVETAPSLSRSRCLRQFGFIEDKSANRNVNICTDNAQPTLYVSQSNTVAIVTNSAAEEEDEMNNFLIGFIGIIFFAIKSQLAYLLFKSRAFFVYIWSFFNFLTS